ncbi:hypothetical protein Pmar_PMAR007307 [Perkinsus marinus ATCC 50983]|uniref:Uncharacterized protein n=1 Tax=Perkinsus marinus (strain ATCC 50983 / TXsc) TaxID=423536 RepID=C5K616_PERM5|nr:hypothetical protein Pmar_PMAR007307 [Perkinsus marinus ATCC 50983]EER20046.1 hypothetical protein Pmar_PMAR007307 [Perkinsus marinus ATCC 50983]|eukprot:XP_002788250.1 hypothetical protein Pmar_PMAR007307 [Perkinsus marinus ATCC 50983]
MSWMSFRLAHTISLCCIVLCVSAATDCSKGDKYCTAILPGSVNDYGGFVNDYHDGFVNDYHKGSVNDYGGFVNDYHDGFVNDYHKGSVNDYYDGFVNDYHDGFVNDYHDGFVNDYHDGFVNDYHDGFVNDYRGFVNDDHEGFVNDDYDGDPSLTDFGASDMGKLWNTGDVYVNIADYTNYDRIHNPERLLPWMKGWRKQTGNTERIWLTYGDTEKSNGKRMADFVDTFEEYLENYISAEDMREIAPIGLSYDIEHMQPEDIKTTLLKAQQMKKDVSKKMGYAPGSLLIDSAIEGQKNTLGTQYIMQYADHATMMLYRNAIDGDYADDLVYRMNYMMTEQCAVCTQPGWENLKAKITIMLEGSCTVGKYCHKLSMCAYDAAAYPNSTGGIEYAWELLNELKARTVSDGILTQEQFDFLYDIHGSLYVVHNWEWVRCYYGDSFSLEMGYSDCLDQYHELSGKCRAE